MNTMPAVHFTHSTGLTRQPLVQVLIPISGLVANPFRDEWFKLKSIDGQVPLSRSLQCSPYSLAC